MSHIATVEIDVKDLDVLQAACTRCGLDLRIGQQEFRWYRGQRSPCEHAIVLPNDATAFEIGLVRRTDGRPGWLLQFDFFNQEELQLRAGDQCNKLRQAYATEAAIRQMRKQGLTVSEQVLANGSIKLQGVR